MKIYAIAIVAVAWALAALACNVSGLSAAPRATFSQIGCLDTNGDHRLNAGDAIDPSKVPDFNGDHSHDANDAAFLRGVDIALDPQREADACRPDASREPEYLVAHGYLSPSNVSCDNGRKAVLVVGVGGGVVNLKTPNSAAGVRSMVDGLLAAYKDHNAQTIAVLSGPAIAGALNIHTGAEQWMTHVVQVYLDRYPCLRVLLLGHSHGAITVDVIAAHLEAQYADRIIQVVDVDRTTMLYVGDTQSRPTQVHVFNIYELSGGILSGAPYDSPNAENWDATGQQAPQNGDKGGPLKPVDHTTIDNSKSVKQRIIDDVMRRSG